MRTEFLFYKDWKYINIFDWFILNYANPFRTYKKIKDIFIPLKCKFTFCRRCLVPIIYISYPALILDLQFHDIEWKDKEGDPRHEESPYICITLFRKWSLVWRWTFNYLNDINYWEQALWYLYYYESYNSNKPDINLAKKNWPWTYYHSDVSTWDDSFLLK